VHTTAVSCKTLKEVSFYLYNLLIWSLGSWCIKETKESTLGKDSLVPLMHHDLNDLELICFVNKCKILFWIEESTLGFSQRNVSLLSEGIFHPV